MRERLWTRDLHALLRLAWPIILARIGVQTMGLVDAVVIGQNSAEQLGFHALGWAPTNTVLTGGIGLLTGLQVMTARRLGEGRAAATGAGLRDGLVYAGGVGLLCTTILMGFGPAFLKGLGLQPALAAGSARALMIYALSLTPYLLACACTFYLEGLGRPMPGLAAMIAANVANLLLDLLLVPGVKGLLPALGAVGAGFATLGARTLLFVWLAIVIVRLPDARELGLFDRMRLPRAERRAQRGVGYGAGASYFVEAGAFSGMTVVAGWLGPLAVAAWAVALNVSAVVFMIPLGLAGATAVLVGKAYGAADLAGVRRAARLGFGVSVAVAATIAALVAPGAGWIARFYATDAALVAAASAALALSAVFFVPDALQAVTAQVLRARGDVLAPTLTHLVSYAAVMLPLGWVLAHPAGLGVQGCMWAVIVASLLSAGLLLARFASLRDPALSPKAGSNA